MLPARSHMNQSSADFFRGDLGVRPGYDGGGFALGGLEQLNVTDEISHAKTRQSRLARAKEFAGTAQFQVEFSDLEAVIGFYHRVETALRVFADFTSCHQDAIRFGAATADAPAQLMKLRQAKALGMLDHHHGRVGHIHAHFDHGGRDQNLQFAALKHAHDLFFQFSVEAAMQKSHLQVGENITAELAIHFDRSFQFALLILGNHGINHVGLMSGSNLLADELPDFR